MKTLPEPDVLGCYFDAGFSPHLAAMHLRWPALKTQRDHRLWDLPHGVRLRGPLPERFGVRVKHWADDAYAVCLVWDDLALRWANVSAAQLTGSALAEVLAALGTDVRDLLDQPIDAPVPARQSSASQSHAA